MASEREYLEKMSTGQLDYFLNLEAYGRNRLTLSSIYLICEILARRDPVRGTARDIFQEFARQFADRRAFSADIV